MADNTVALPVEDVLVEGAGNGAGTQQARTGKKVQNTAKRLRKQIAAGKRVQTTGPVAKKKALKKAAPAKAPVKKRTGGAAAKNAPTKAAAGRAPAKKARR